MSLQVEEVLFQAKSEFQDVLVFRSTSFGNVLVLDGAIQITERDEFSYQEMIAHLPLHAHPNPKKVLVIGGGDGGVLREIARHPQVEEIHICEIDQMVIDVSKKFLPGVACGFDDPRVRVHIYDGFKFLDEHANEFDVIITDSSDPEGPAEALFQVDFFRKCHGALRENGILCTQGECVWLHLDLLQKMSSFIGTVFAKVQYAWTSIPTYPSGTIGFWVCSKGGFSCRRPIRELPPLQQSQLRYYTPEIHEAAFALPAFVRAKLPPN